MKVRLFLWVAIAALPLAAPASEPVVAELEQRLLAHGVEGVNDHLESHPSDMAVLGQITVDCDLEAVSLSVKLSRSANAKVAEGHREALRAAAGRCTGFVLALLSAKEVPKICASVSSWAVMQTARELRRRIRSIESDAVLGASRRGKACKAAYLHELRNTRVGLRALPPGARPP